MTNLSAASIAGLSEPRVDAFKVSVDSRMDLREGHWDSAVRRQEVWVWATREDGTIDLAKAARAHAVADLKPEGRDATSEDLKLPIAGVEDGELIGFGDGIRQALLRLDEVKDLDAAVEKKARDTLCGMLDRLSEQTCGTVDGEVWRWSRVQFDLDEAQTSVIDRAISIGDRLADRSDANEIKAIADELRADGFGDHIDGGFLKIPVLAARTGTQVYSDGASQWGEFRSDGEVGDAESLASYGLKPFTDDHPSVMVTPANYTQFAKGSCGQDAALLEDLDPDGNRYVRVTILVGDLATLRKIRDGKLELSAGYTTVTVRDSGVSPDGQKFDFRQTRIRINHLALVDRGRAGPLARIQLDGAAWELASTTDQESSVTKDQLDPETAAMLFAAVKAYQTPESPEAAEVALGQLAAMTGMDPEAIRTALMLEVASEPEPDAELELVEMDGIEARMTPDHATKWRAREQTSQDLLKAAKEEQDKMTADTAKTNTDMAKDLAEQKAITAGMQRQVDALIGDKSQADTAALYSEIVDVCPQLGKAWDDLKKAAKFSLNDAQMREAATLDLDPGAAKDLNDAREGDTFDATLSGAYKAAVRGAQNRKRAANSDAADDNTNTGATNVVAMDKLSAAAGGFYGSKNR